MNETKDKIMPESKEKPDASPLIRSTGYESTANELSARILRLIDENPEIINMESAWDLFQVDGFDCSDLQPSLAQAGWALREAKRLFFHNAEFSHPRNED